MNDLGLMLAWLAVQVALLLLPALMLHALASRRGPAPGAWIASLSLGLVVALNVAVFVPRIRSDEKQPFKAIAPPAVTIGVAPATDIPSGSTRTVNDPHPAAGRANSLAWLHLAWDRLERGAAEPAARCRPWGSLLAVLALAGTGAGFLRLMVGLWAVALCCRRGRRVFDSEMIGLLEELRHEMGCHQTVTLREVPDLTTPATAGLRRPMLLLPDDWRSWSLAERRAVLAHELAHIVRGDYAAGLIAWLAVVLNYYHPLVHWMAGRLQLQQEQSADAIGARFAGGSARYLVALSSLALRQDGRSPCWPARAFLPARGTLIRRIAMLRDQSQSKTFDRTWSNARRSLTAFGLIGLTVGVATLRGPARGAEDAPPPATKAEVAAPESRDQAKPFGPLYFREGADGVIIVRPAAALRHNGVGRVVPLLGADFVDVYRSVADQLKIDTSRPGFLTLRGQDIEWVAASVSFGRHKGGSKDKEPVHTFMLGLPVVRTAEPFDWLAYLRQWKLEFEEARLGGRVYYKVGGKLREALGKSPCVFLPDDRTIVFDEEPEIRKIVSSEQPELPAFLRSPAWKRASRGLLAYAIKNQDDSFAKDYDLGRPDDAVVLSLFKGIDWWLLGVDDDDDIVLRAEAACRNREASEAVSRSLESLIKLGDKAIEQELQHDQPKTPTDELIVRMFKALMAGVRVEHTDKTISVQTQGFGTLADFAAVVEGQVQETKGRVAARKGAKKGVKQ
jgi:beta-lactamase regulating signal transducer with metallopeptidase domain